MVEALDQIPALFQWLLLLTGKNCKAEHCIAHGAVLEKQPPVANKIIAHYLDGSFAGL